MRAISRGVLLVLVSLGLIGNAWAQGVAEEERPKLHVPLRPPTKKEVDELAALHLFARGVMCEREDRLVEAMQFYENAAKLDPEAVTIQKSLLVIYIAMERYDDAGKLLKAILELDPHDCETSYLYARLLRNRGKLEEACDVLEKGLQSNRVRERSDLHQQMAYDLGAGYERLEKFEKAAAAFTIAAAILDHPDALLQARMSEEEIVIRSSEAHERIGRNFLEAGKFDKAATAFREAQTRFPAGAGRLDYNLAQVYLRQGKLDEATTALQSYLKMMPQGTEGYELMIGVLQKQRRTAEVLPMLEQAAAKDTFNVGLQLLLARQYIRADQLAKADKIYQDLAASGPTEQIYKELFLLHKDHRPKGEQAIVEMIDNAFLASTGKTGVAANASAPAQARAMVGALRDNPDLTRPVVKAAANLAAMQPLQVDTLQILATFADRLGMLAEAETLYRECIKQPLPAATEPLIYGSMLQVLWKAHHYEAVVDMCRTGLKQTQACNRVLLRAELARALGQLQRWKEALSEADQAVREAGDSDMFVIRSLRIRLLTQADKTADAEAECKALIEERKLPGEILETHYLLASIYSNSNRLAQAEAELAACLKIDPDNVAVNNDLGYQWADQNKNLAEAEAMIRKAIELDRKNRQSFAGQRPGKEAEFHDNACYIDSLGWVLFRRGQAEAARKELEYATTLPDGDDPVIHDHLGDVLQALGQRDRAIAAWRQAQHFYEEAKHRKMDERYQTLQKKLKAALALGGR